MKRYDSAICIPSLAVVVLARPLPSIFVHLPSKGSKTSSARHESSSLKFVLVNPFVTSIVVLDVELKSKKITSEIQLDLSSKGREHWKRGAHRFGSKSKPYGNGTLSIRQFGGKRILTFPNLNGNTLLL